jgi:hypothetical protein
MGRIIHDSEENVPKHEDINEKAVFGNSYNISRKRVFYIARTDTAES